MSGWFDSFNQAVGFTQDPAETQQNINDANLAYQERIYNQQRSDFAPYQQMGTSYLPYISTYMTGKESQIIDPNLKKVSNNDKYQRLDNWLAERGLPSQRQLDYRTRPDLISGAPMEDSYSYVDALGKKVDNPYITVSPVNIYDSAAYNIQKGQLDRNMNRQMAATGRLNSTYGMDSMNRAYGNLAAQEYEKGYNRLLDAVKIGQGAASSAGANNSAMMSAYGNYANTASQIAGNTANRQNASLYGAIGTGLNAYNTFGNKGGAGGGGYGYGDLWTSSGGDINNVEFGSDWGNWSDGTAA